MGEALGFLKIFKCLIKEEISYQNIQVKNQIIFFKVI